MQAPERFVHGRRWTIDGYTNESCEPNLMTKDWLCACGYRLRSLDHDCHDPVWYCIDCGETAIMTDEEHDCSNE